MALEDALILSRALALYREDISAALSSYECARRDRTARVVQQSALGLDRLHSHSLSGDDTTLTTYFEREWSVQKLRERFEWLHSYDARTAVI